MPICPTCRAEACIAQARGVVARGGGFLSTRRRAAPLVTYDTTLAGFCNKSVATVGVAPGTGAKPFSRRMSGISGDERDWFSRSDLDGVAAASDFGIRVAQCG